MNKTDTNRIRTKKYYNGSVTVNGAEMAYVRFGTGPVNAVLLPGLTDGLVGVRGKARMLAQTYRKYLRDFTVYMFSRKDPLPEGWSIRDMAADQAEAMRILGIGKACVMGVSEGGMIVQYLAADHPEAVDRLVLAVTAPYANEHAKEFVRLRMEDAKRADHKAIMIGSAESTYSDRKLRSYRRLYPLLGLIGRPKDYARFMVNAEAILNFDARDVLKRITCPTLVIGGAKDRTVGPGGSAELHDAVAGSELYIYQDLGHAAFDEAPDFNDRVFGFFSGASRNDVRE